MSPVGARSARPDNTQHICGRPMAAPTLFYTLNFTQVLEIYVGACFQRFSQRLKCASANQRQSLRTTTHYTLRVKR